MTEQTRKFTNIELAAMFELIADLLEIKGEIVYKTLAYRRAADSLHNLAQDVNDIWRAGQLKDIPGVGKAIADKIDELLRTGHLGFLDRLGEEVPLSLVELLRVPDLGPKKAALFWRQAGITNLQELEDAARAGKLRSLPGIGEKSEARILAGLEALSRRTTRIPLGRALPLGRQLVAWLIAQPAVRAAELAGSLRRMRETIGDIDLVAATDSPEAIMKAFVEHPLVTKVYAQGVTKSSVELRGGIPAQLWLHPPAEFGTALQYATGSKEHSVRLREIAQARGFSLSDHSLLYPDGHETFLAEEAEVYAAVGLPWIPPELREDHGEIQAARKGALPHLIQVKDVHSELHSHSTWSDGQATIREMAQAAIDRDYQVLAVTDHSGSLGIAGGMSVEAVRRRAKEIAGVQREIGDQLILLQGAEVEIRADGSLDYPDDVLAELDIVIASLHTGLRQPGETVTQRLLGAVGNRHVDIIGHPTGRLIAEREGADLDMEAVFAAAREHGVALEINANPSRLDLNDVYARRAKDLGIPLSINTDAHAPDQLDLLEYGVATARRGWIEPDDVINTWPVERLISWLKSR
jgi:DNA polymerase (family 10)